MVCNQMCAGVPLLTLLLLAIITLDVTGVPRFWKSFGVKRELDCRLVQFLLIPCYLGKQIKLDYQRDEQGRKFPRNFQLLYASMLPLIFNALVEEL
jgi:hypothetical protein